MIIKLKAHGKEFSIEIESSENLSGLEVTVFELMNEDGPDDDGQVECKEIIRTLDEQHYSEIIKGPIYMVEEN